MNNPREDVTILPLHIRFGDDEYADGVFEEAYEKAVSAGETVIVITISGKLSGTCQSARIAAEDYEGKVFVVDSLNATIGGALAIKPVVAVSDGEIIMLGKARGSKNGSNFLIREIEKADGVDFSRPFCLGYTGLSDELLQKYIHDSEHLWKDYAKKLPISTLGATIGTHVGPGAVAVAFFEH